MDTQALLLTLKLAASTTALLLFFAVPLAWWIASGDGVLRAVTRAVVALPLVLPPTVLGFYLLIAMGPLTAPGRMLIRVIGHPLAFSFWGLLIGSLVYSLPFAVQPLVAGFSSVDTAYLEAAAGLGIAPWQSFRRVVLPLSTSSLVTAAVLTFTHTVGEFGVVLMLGGNIPGATRTLSIALYDRVEDFDLGGANHIAGLLLMTSLAALLIVYVPQTLRRRDGRHGNVRSRQGGELV